MKLSTSTIKALSPTSKTISRFYGRLDFMTFLKLTNRRYHSSDAMAQLNTSAYSLGPLETIGTFRFTGNSLNQKAPNLSSRTLIFDLHNQTIQG